MSFGIWQCYLFLGQCWMPCASITSLFWIRVLCFSIHGNWALGLSAATEHLSVKKLNSIILIGKDNWGGVRVWAKIWGFIFIHDVHHCSDFVVEDHYWDKILWCQWLSHLFCLLVVIKVVFNFWWGLWCLYLSLSKFNNIYWWVSVTIKIVLFLKTLARQHQMYRKYDVMMTLILRDVVSKDILYMWLFDLSQS